ncbi:DUF421 domain-containing protein [Microbacterium oryzae]|uniref:DUF421 domain-containing protein n=1 Tax=Microbacterium oryzae TaxID=743009 RepID=UPI0025B01D9D|nr:YetF domain-containing protein [Microbacterium oryzae]MDN3312029.1 DUF421 domain-containing protein [Microbacterium oryzae]
MWFDTWSDVLRVIVIGTASYTALIVLLRLTGKRSLSQLNAFDFVVTVALGSTLATILLSSDVSYTEGVVALGLLLALQLIVSFLSTRIRAFRRAITAEPVLLVRDGSFRREAMASARVTEAEVHQAVRGSGSGSLSDIAAVVLETNGKFSVITKAKAGDGSALSGVPGF